MYKISSQRIDYLFSCDQYDIQAILMLLQSGLYNSHLLLERRFVQQITLLMTYSIAYHLIYAYKCKE